MDKEQLTRLRRRAHKHDDTCLGGYRPCGEHHAHDDKCGGRDFICGTREELDLIALLADWDHLKSATQ